MTEKSAKEGRRKPLRARPQPGADRAAVRLRISRRFAVSLEYLAR